MGSWLQWTDWSFRLVANGCSPDEVARLRQMCEAEPRLSLVVLSAETLMLHGQALNYLFAQSDEPFFGFLDSDILATGPMPAGLMSEPEQALTCVAAMPIWWNAERSVLWPDSTRIPGRYHHTTDGLFLGNTYFALYRRDCIDSLIKETGISFEKCFRADVPERYVGRLEQANLLKKQYDTGKLLNMLMQIEGGQAVELLGSTVCHLGGVSEPANRWRRKRRRFRTLWGKLAKGTPPGPLRHFLLAREFHYWIAQFHRNLELQVNPERSWNMIASLQRLMVTSYFSQLLHALVRQKRISRVPDFHDPAIQSCVEQATAIVCRAYTEFGKMSRFEPTGKSNHLVV